jgi:hypothetical protein
MVVVTRNARTRASGSRFSEAEAIHSVRRLARPSLKLVDVWYDGEARMRSQTAVDEDIWTRGTPYRR